MRLPKDDVGLPVVGGWRLEGTLADHVRGCRVLIDQEQTSAHPDNALISLLCDSVRLAREYDRAKTGEKSKL